MQLRVDTGTYQNIGHVITFGFSSGIGWLIAIVALAAIREKMDQQTVKWTVQTRNEITVLRVRLLQMLELEERNNAIAERE